MHSPAVRPLDHPVEGNAVEGTQAEPLAPAVQLAQVFKAYGRSGRAKPALNGVSLRIERGQCYGLAGPNGAGKTTLIKIMLGLVQPDAGEVRLFGDRPDLPEVRRRVGFVPEAAEMPHGATPLQLVARWAQLRGLNRCATAEEGERQLLRLGMQELLKRPVHRLSKGEKQRTLLALALLNAPDLLILDEPTDGLDPLGRALMRRVIEEECAAGRTVFLNSHLLSETERICTRVGILHRGRLVREETLNRAHAFHEQGTTLIRLESPLAPEEAQTLGLQPTPDVDGRYRVDHATLTDLNLTIDRLRARGALLMEVQRVQANIEETLTQVAAGVESATLIAETGPLVEGPPLASSLLDRPRATLRVAREIASDLWARRILHVGFIGALLVLALLVYVSQEQLATGARAAGRMIARSREVNDVISVGKWVGGAAAISSHWSLLVCASFLAALFAPPVLEPRRAILLQAQPVSRGDIATGIFVSVFGIATALFVFFDGLLFAALRYLGGEVSFRFLFTPLLTALAFGAVYAGTLCATYLFPSGLFAGLVGLGQIVLFSILNTLPDAQLGKATGLRGFALSMVPKLNDLGSAAMTLGGGSTPAPFPIVAAGIYMVALLLLLQVIARRRER
jgi:ABC-2 type transport system ATP-binding protein